MGGLEDDFEMALLQGVSSIQIEQAMAEHKIPPLKPTLRDVSEPIDPKRILIVSTWRTGSSFLGELIHSAPGVFYSYEPLHFMEGKNGRSMDLIQSIFNCEFSTDYLRHVNGLTQNGQEFMSRNRRVWEACNRVKGSSLCARKEFVSRLCTHFPIQLIKVVRLRMEHLNEASIKGLKVVYLARDPRGIYASRLNLTWCQNDPHCSQVSNLCSDVDRDSERMQQLSRQWPDRFYLLRFEDLSLNVKKETEKLFQFLQMPVSLTVKVFLNTHTLGSSSSSSRRNKSAEAAANHNSNNPFSTSRLSTSVAHQWRSKLSEEEISVINSECSSVLSRLNYTAL